MDPVTSAIVGGGGLVLGFLLCAVLNRVRGRSDRRQCADRIEAARAEAERLLRQAELDAGDERIRKREALDAETSERRKEHLERERRLARREDGLERKDELLAQREERLDHRDQESESRHREAGELVERQRVCLAGLSDLSAEEARELLLSDLSDEVAREEAHRLERLDERLDEVAADKARHAISQAIQRVASEHTAEATTSTIDLPSDELKGRIIGREGRNIRTFEKVSGVDVIVDDTPGIVIVSTFDSIRREVARQAMERLIQDGRIHPSRIEEVIEQVRGEVEKGILERGKQVQFETNVLQIPPKIQRLLGQLMYRSSYGQNMLLHSIEVCHLTGILAGELGLDVKLAKRCGLLHDIGKALDHEKEGGHPVVGRDFAAACNEAPEVLDAIEFHHDSAKARTCWTTLTAAVDAISAARPGARRESFERYINRLQRLEEVATRHEGVEQAYAIQAGREIRVIVNDHKIDDGQAKQVARRIAQDIEEELTYPGEIRVTLIRETRVTEYAR